MIKSKRLLGFLFFLARGDVKAERQILDRNLRFTNTVSFVRTMQTSVIGDSTKSSQVEFYIKDIKNQVLSSKVIEKYNATEAKDFEKLEPLMKRFKFFSC